MNEDFIPVDQVPSVAVHRHTVMRGRFLSSPKIWYKKEMKNPVAAKNEVVAQEFFRLAIQHQPVTRIIQNDLGVYYILSEEVVGFKTLPRGEADKFANGNIKGLGQALLLALFLEEADLKNGNIGINRFNQVIKIDGDWSFAAKRKDKFQERHKYKYRENFSAITTQIITKLPLAQGFYCYNWLDYVREGQSTRNGKPRASCIVDANLHQAPAFQNEVNQAILKICLIPDEFIEAFVDSLFANENYYIDFLKDRREKLKNAALYSEAFQQYLSSPQAKHDYLEILAQMKSFHSQGQNKVLSPSKEVTVEKKVAHLWKKLNLRTANHDLLNQVAGSQVNEHDIFLSEFITATRKMIVENPLEIDQEKINEHIQETLDAVSSREIIAIKSAVKGLENANTWLGGKQGKIDTILRALNATPLLKRKDVFTQPGLPNAVQEALAAHRFFTARGTVYKDESGQISVHHAASMYKKLHRHFFQPHEVFQGSHKFAELKARFCG